MSIIVSAHISFHSRHIYFPSTPLNIRKKKKAQKASVLQYVITLIAPSSYLQITHDNQGLCWYSSLKPTKSVVGGMRILALTLTPDRGLSPILEWVSTQVVYFIYQNTLDIHMGIYFFSPGAKSWNFLEKWETSCCCFVSPKDSWNGFQSLH